LQVKIRTEERTRITPFRRAVFDIVARDIDRRVAEIRVSLPIPDRVEKRRIVKELYFLGEALGGFGLLG
jgi:hypothetical protein